MPYIFNLLILSSVFFIYPWIERISRKLNISYSILIIILSLVLFYFFPNLSVPLINQNLSLITHFTELIIIISLMNIGLSIDKNFSFQHWKRPLLLVTIGMGSFMILTFLLSQQLLGLNIATSLLLAAILAPTDPVLASDVQIGPPHEKKENPNKLVLSIEAGLNDGLAFPFVWFAIQFNNKIQNPDWFQDWILNDLFLKLIIGIVIGILAGKIINWLFFKLPRTLNSREVRYGLVSLSSTLFTYSLTEILGGYGFIAVFIAAVVIRNFEIHHTYHNKLHEFNSQLEHTLMIIALFYFTGIGLQLIPTHFELRYFIFALILIFLVRPISSFISQPHPFKQYQKNLLLSFFGIKGIGSIFYLSYALSKSNFPYQEELWTVTYTIIISSVFIHGITANQAITNYGENNKN